MDINLKMKDFLKNSFNINFDINYKNIEVKDFDLNNYLDFSARLAFDLLNRIIFYDHGIVVTLINSQPIYFSKNLFEIILKIFNQLYIETDNDNRIKVLKGFYFEFLALYIFSLEKKVYQNDDRYTQVLEKTKNENVIPKLLSSKELIQEYYDLIVNTRIFKQELIMPSFTYRIYNVNKIIYFDTVFLQELYIGLVKQKRFMSELYDSTPKQIRKNPKYVIEVVKYFTDIKITRLTDIELLSKCWRDIESRDLNFISRKSVNSIIDEVNSLIEEPKSIIENLSSISGILEKTTIISSFINKIDECLFEKNRECILALLSYKRHLLKKQNLNFEEDLNMKHFNIPIGNESIQYAKNMVEKNYYNLYSFIKIDIRESMRNAIKTKSKYPLSYIVKTYEINQKNRVYRVSDEIDSKFKKGIEKIGLEIQQELLQEININEREKELPNVFDSGFYESFIKEVSTKIQFNLALLNYVTDTKRLNDFLLHEISKMFGLNGLSEKKELFSNNQILISFIILIIEEFLRRESNKLSLKAILYDLYNRYSNCLLKSDVFLIYYILYAEEGYKIRHNIMHGNSIESNLESELILILVCLVSLRNILVNKHE